MSEIDIQYDLFRALLERELTEDEEYLIRNAYNNGKEQGKNEIRGRLIGYIDSM